MKREITFSNSVATVERSKSAALLQLSPIQVDKLAILADTINEADGITVITILPSRGKVVFTVEKSITNGEVIDVICEAIGKVYDADTSVSFARTETTDEG